MTVKNWMFLIALGAAFGASFGLNEVLLASYGPLTVSMLRVMLGSLGCWIWVAVSGRPVMSLPGPVAGLFVFGIFQYAAPFALLPLAQEHIASSVAGIANAMTPVAVVVVSQLWAGGERATGNKIVGIAFGFAGILALTAGGTDAGGSDPRFIILAIAAPVSYGIALNFVRRFRSIDPVFVTTWAMTGGALAIAPAALTLEGIPAMPDATSAAALGVLGLVLTSAAFLFMYSILPRVGATNLSLVTFVAPVSALLIGAFVFDEHISIAHIGGISLILMGLVAIDGRIVRVFRGWAFPPNRPCDRRELQRMRQRRNAEDLNFAAHAPQFTKVAAYETRSNPNNVAGCSGNQAIRHLCKYPALGRRR